MSSIKLRFDIVGILFGARRNLHRIALANDANVALQIAFGAAEKVIRIGEQRPFVIKQMICRIPEVG